jgi:hypothetical protein
MATDKNTFGTTFERIFMSLIAIATGALLIYLAIMGPLLLHQIKYKTADVVNNQLIGQDIINLFVLSPMLIVGGIALFLRKTISKYLLIMTPFYLIYFALSYTIGWEWSSSTYVGNNQQYTFHFLFILIASLLLMLYSLSIFPKNVVSNFKRKGLVVYSIIFSVFLSIFAAMWIKEVNEVISTGVTRGYDLAPTAFWLIRIFDLGFTIPLGFISVYLLWTRTETTYPIQFMFYGFFLTMILAVNAMGLMMLLNNDPMFLIRDLIVFGIIALIVFAGFIYILRHYKVKE